MGQGRRKPKLKARFESYDSSLCEIDDFITLFGLKFDPVDSQRFEAMAKLVRVQMVRVQGIEPWSQAWEARVLPLNDTRRINAV